MYAAYLYLLNATLRDDPALRERDARERQERFEPEPPVGPEPPRDGPTRDRPLFQRTVPSNC